MLKFLNNRFLIWPVLLFILTISTVIPLTRSGFFYSHDGIMHAARLVAFHHALLDGQFPPTWGANLTFGLGSPALMFYGFLPYLLAEIPLIINFSYTNSIEVIFALGLILSGVTFFLWSKYTFKNPLIALTGSILYIWSPYRFVDVYVRGAYPESFIFIFPPLLLIAGQMLAQKNKYDVAILLAAITITLTVLTHTVLALAFIAIFIVYTMALSDRVNWKKISVGILFSVTLGLGLCAFFWIPALAMSKDINSNILATLAIYKTNFVPLARLVYSRWGWGIVNSNNSIATHLGLAQLLVLLLCIFSLVKYKLGFAKKKNHQIIFTLILLLVVTIFLMTFYSNTLWEKLYILNLFVYPWRLLSLTTFLIPVVGCYFLSQLKYKKIVAVSLIFLAVIAGRNQLQFASWFTGDDKYYETYQGTTDIAGEFLPKGTNRRIIDKCYIQHCNFPKLEGLNTKDYKIVESKSNQLRAIINLTKATNVTINTLYFPGWKIYLDSKPTNFAITDLGTITLTIPPGHHNVVLRLERNLIQEVSLYISIISLLSAGIYIFIKLVKRSFAHHGLY